MKYKQLGATLALALICSMVFAREGYKITIKTISADSLAPEKTPLLSDKAVLYLSGWDNRVAIDSASSNGKGVYKLKGKQNLTSGEYTIKTGSGEIVLFVSEDGKIREKLKLEGKKCEQVKGKPENALFIDFQNFVNYGWKETDNPAIVGKLIDSITQKAEEQHPESLFNLMLEGYSSNPDYNKIFSDSRILHTRFGKNFIESFFKSIEYNHTDSVIANICRIIETSSPNIKPLIAAEAFRYFSKPAVMGQESVAFHIAEEYFTNGKLEFPYKGLDFEIKTFIMLNGKSLVGMEAQDLPLQDTSGANVSLKELILQGEYTILYFYTDDCITCKIETPKLVDFVNEYNHGVINVFTVYTQDYKERWKSYVKENFTIYNPFVNWTDAADPDFESGFHLLYNVISTPQIYLIDNQGTIIGRGLSVNSLKELIERLEANQDDLHLFFKNFFEGRSNRAEVYEATDRFYTNCKKSPALFREIFSELYLFFKFSDCHLLKEGAVYLAENYILGKPQEWSTHYVERTAKELEQLKKNSPGEVITDIDGIDSNGKKYNIHSIAGEYKVLCLYNSQCNGCLPSVEQLNNLEKRYSNKNIAFISADISKKRENWEDYVTNNNLKWLNLWVTNEDMHKRYYLGSLPLIYLLDSNNRVIARNLTPVELEKILEQIH
ncbi:MAG: redoxin domain-containing protein [Bacteroidales bacterium]|nr:redoxin domain-containing protein [Bacteroidales bacterium]